jgi:hypothetical protein
MPPSTITTRHPGRAEAAAQQRCGAAKADIIRDGSMPEAAADAAFKTTDAILANTRSSRAERRP